MSFLLTYHDCQPELLLPSVAMLTGTTASATPQSPGHSRGKNVVAPASTSVSTNYRPVLVWFNVLGFMVL